MIPEQHVSDATIAELADKMEAAHERFSAAYHAREDAEIALQGISEKRSSLVARFKALKADLASARLSAFNAAIEGGPDSTTRKLAGVESQFAVLGRARQWFDLFPAADAERAVLTAAVSELELRHEFELARLTHHEAEVVKLLEVAAAADGEVELASEGPRTRKLRELAEATFRELLDARRALKDHDRDIEAARLQFTKSEVENG